MLAGKCSHPYWLTVSIVVPETKQSESWSCSSGIGTHTHTSSWVSYPTLSSGPSASAEEAKIMPRLPSTASCFCPRSQSKSFHVFAAFCILLFFYSGPLFPSFSNYLPNKSHSLIDTSTETPKAQERIRWTRGLYKMNLQLGKELSPPSPMCMSTHPQEHKTYKLTRMHLVGTWTFSYIKLLIILILKPIQIQHGVEHSLKHGNKIV